MNGIVKTIDRAEQLHSMGFESERQYAEYMQLRKALSRKVVIGIAS